MGKFNGDGYFLHTCLKLDEDELSKIEQKCSDIWNKENRTDEDKEYIKNMDMYLPKLKKRIDISKQKLKEIKIEFEY